MNKLAFGMLSFILITAIFVSFPSAVIAAPDDDPVVTPVSGDMEFSTEVIPIASLPGLTEFGQMLLPAGFPKGEAQFGGNGIQVTKMDKGKATACFSLSTTAINEGWGGKVGAWDGAKWILLTTTIKSQEESNTSLACATITRSGTYAFIKYVTDPSLLPKTHACGFVFSGYFVNDNRSYGATGWDSNGPNTFIMLFFNPDFPVGVPVNYTILNIDPAGTITTGLTGSTITIIHTGWWPTPTPAAAFSTIVTYTDLSNYDVQLEFPTLGCTQVVPFPWGNITN